MPPHDQIPRFTHHAGDGDAESVFRAFPATGARPQELQRVTRMPDRAIEKPQILAESLGDEVRQVIASGSGAPELKRDRPPARRYGQWLREQRLMRCWSGGEMARRLREAAASAGYKLPDNRCLLVMIYRWEDDRSGISARYRTLYCRALGIPFSEFGQPVPQPATVSPPLLSDVLTDVAQMLAEAAVKLLGALEACGMTPGTLAESARRTSALADRVLAARRDLNGRCERITSHD